MDMRNDPNNGVAMRSGLYRPSQACPACPEGVALFAGEGFPKCPRCGNAEFELVQAAEPIERDPDFSC